MSAPRILIVGGVAGGASAATRARRMNEQAEIVIFERGPYVSFANCGLPYYIGGAITDREALLLSSPEQFRKLFNVEVHTGHEVTAIDRQAREVEVLERETGNRRRERYDKLILAPGAAPMVPPWEGTQCGNVFTLRDVPDTDRIKSTVDDGAKKAVVIGAGYIGLEMVENLHHRGLEVTLVEMMPQILPIMDADMTAGMQETLAAKGVKLMLGTTVENLIVECQGVRAVQLADGSELPTDMVVVSIGVRPEVKLAKEAGLTIGQSGGIAVNEYSQTNDPNIYAVGDAVESRHAVTGQVCNVPLAGPANRHGRLAGEHAATGQSRPTAAINGTAVVGVMGMTAAMTGLSEKAAKRAGVKYATAYALRGHHVGYYPGAQQMILKLLYNPETGRVLGGQAVGGDGVDKRIDVIATAIHFKGTVDDLCDLDLCYAPQYGSAKDPVHIAAFVARNQMDGLVQQLPPGHPPIGQYIDVRGPAMHNAARLPGAENIPLPMLREHMGRLNKKEPVTVHCQVGQTSYMAARILMQSGFEKVWNLAGGFTMNQQYALGDDKSQCPACNE